MAWAQYEMKKHSRLAWLSSSSAHASRLKLPLSQLAPLLGGLSISTVTDAVTSEFPVRL